MLSFRCNICRKCMIKSAINKHYHLICRFESKKLTCMNCLNTFYGEAYLGHNKCFSVEQRKKKKAQEQKRWIDIIRSVLDNTEYQLSPQLRDAFQSLLHRVDVSQKRKSFMNIIIHNMKMSESQATEMWNILLKDLEQIDESFEKAEFSVRRHIADAETVPEADVPSMRRINVENGEATQGEETVQKADMLIRRVSTYKCNICGERVKRLKVKGHNDMICRKRKNKKNTKVSCKNCLKTFYGDAYLGHVKCFLVDQESWMNIIRFVLDNTECQLTAQLRGAFQSLLRKDVSQKRKNFINIIIHDMKMSESQATEMWNILYKELEKIYESFEKAELSVRKQIADAETVPEADVPSMRRIKLEDGEARLTKTEDKVPEAVPPVKRIKMELEEATQAEEAVPESDVPPVKRIKLENGEATRIEETVPRADVPLMRRIKMEKMESTQTETSETDPEPNVPPMKRIKLENGEAAQTEAEAAAAATEETSDFDWAAQFTKLVVKQPDGIVLKKLKKKLAKKYTRHLSVTELSEKQSKKFDKRFNKQLKKLMMEGDLVK